MYNELIPSLTLGCVVRTVETQFHIMLVRQIY